MNLTGKASQIGSEFLASDRKWSLCRLIQSSTLQSSLGSHALPPPAHRRTVQEQKAPPQLYTGLRRALPHLSPL